MSVKAWTSKIKGHRWLAGLVALAGGILYLVQLWAFAHTRESVLDEGAYLYKGLLFVTGQYKLYQPDGPWSNHMPLAFLIPGAIQAWFGPGLATARFFAILIGCLFLLGLWVITRRLGGYWWAALSVWLVVLNTGLEKTYSMALSQGLIACLLVWMFAAVLGEKRSLWQIAAGSMLASVIILIRINMLPVLPLLVLYVFWQYGRRAGILATLAGGGTLLLGHALFWPGILTMWAYWLPREITPFLNAYRLPPGYQRLWDPQIPFITRLYSLFQSIRFHFIAILGILATWLLWPSRQAWRRRSDFRSAVFLSITFLALELLHIWATLGKNYCVFCLTGYTAFYAVTGFLLVVITFAAWRRRLPAWRQLIIAGLLLILAAGVGFGGFEDLSEPLLSLPTPASWLAFPGNIRSGSNTIESVLTERFQMPHLTQRQLISTAAGLAAGLAMLGFALVIHLATKLPAKKSAFTPSFAYSALLVFMGAGILLTPTIFLSGGLRAYDCSGDTIASYQAAGEHLRRLIPPGSRVYWKGGLSVVPLLYVPGIQIYAPQINGDYSYYLGGDPETLLRFGFWNDELNRKWLEEADYALVQERYYKEWAHSAPPGVVYDELEPSPPSAACLPGSRIHVFKRIKD